MKGKKGNDLFLKLLFVFLITIPALAKAAPPTDAVSLKGLTSAKAVFDISIGDPKMLNLYLNLIDDTAKSMREQGVKPEFVLTFRGPASFYTSMDRERIELENFIVADKISAKLESLSKSPGIKLAQCGLAANMLRIDIKTINPALSVVGNSWISIIAYQNKGYALIPVQ